MSKEINTVTISLKEYDELRELKKNYDKNKFFIHKELIPYHFGFYERFYVVTNDKALEAIIKSSTEIIDDYRVKIAGLEHNLSMKEPVKREKKWYQL